jgi:hypothetical protein
MPRAIKIIEKAEIAVRNRKKRFPRLSFAEFILQVLYLLLIKYKLFQKRGQVKIWLKMIDRGAEAPWC